MAEHVTSVRTYVVIYVILMALLGLTVGLAYADLGKLEALPGYLIAAIKAVLVILFFMEVRVQNRAIALVACVGFVWLAVLIIFSVSDYATRGWSPQDEVLRTQPQALVSPHR